MDAEQKRLLRTLRATDRALHGQGLRRHAGAVYGALRARTAGIAGAAYTASRMVGSAVDLETKALHLGNVIVAPDRDAAVGRAIEHDRQFSRRSLADRGEMLDIQYQLGSAGLDAESALAGSEVVHELATITKGESAAVASVLMTAVDNFGGDLTAVGEVLARTQFRYPIEHFGQLGDALAEAASGATTAGLSIEQTAVALGLLHKGGHKGSVAGTALNAVLRNLTKASSELGTSVVRGADDQLDLVATLQQIGDATANLDTDTRGDLMQKIFGDEGKKGVQPLLTFLDDLRAGVQDTPVGGTIDKEGQKFLESAGGRLKIATGNLRD